MIARTCEYKNEAKASFQPEPQQQAAPAQCKGYDARTNYPLPPAQPKPKNTGLPDKLKAGIEHLSGYSMDDVQVHYNSDKPAQLQAHAYAQGNKIHVAPGQEQHLPHEAWHVVQQKQGRVKATMQLKGKNINHDRGLEHEADMMGSRAIAAGGSPEAANRDFAGASGSSASPYRTTTPAGGSSVIQGDIGFEFEAMQTEVVRCDADPLPKSGFPDERSAFRTLKHQRYLKKGDVVLKRSDIEIQADIRTSRTYVEVVTRHFPLTREGKQQMLLTMAAFNQFLNDFSNFSARSGSAVPAVALDNSGDFKTVMKDAVIVTRLHTDITKPQITFGTRVGNIADIVRDLYGDPSEMATEKSARDPGRLRIRNADPNNATEPVPLHHGNESNTLVQAYTLGQQAIHQYRQTDHSAPDGADITGLLTLIFSYGEGMGFKQAFLKEHTPLLAKTDLATAFATMDPHTTRYYSQKDQAGETFLEKIVGAIPAYASKMDRPLFFNVSISEINDVPDGGTQWYHALTLRSWLRGIVMRDRTMGEAFLQFFKDSHRGSRMRPGVDQLSTKSFPGRPADQEVEGYATLGKKMDRDASGRSVRLPIFELRSITKSVRYSQLTPWMSDVFDYIQSLNEGRHILMP